MSDSWNVKTWTWVSTYNSVLEAWKSLGLSTFHMNPSVGISINQLKGAGTWRNFSMFCWLSSNPSSWRTSYIDVHEPRHQNIRHDWPGLSLSPWIAKDCDITVCRVARISYRVQSSAGTLESPQCHGHFPRIFKFQYGSVIIPCFGVKTSGRVVILLTT